MTDRFSQSRLLWTPLNLASTNVERFRGFVNRRHPTLHIENYQDLHRYSVGDFEFWWDLWQFSEIIHSSPPERVVEPGHTKETLQWFPGSRLNYAQNILRRSDDAVACTMVGELGVIGHVTFRQLREKVREMAAAMRSFGISRGDRVAAIVTNSVTAIVLLLATASIGGIYSSTAPDMGPKGVLDRYRQIQPKLLFLETEVFYAGKIVQLLSNISTIVLDLFDHGLKQAVLLPSTITGNIIPVPYDLAPNTATLSEFLSKDDGMQLTFEQLPFQHELLILFSSGTTGTPKCIVHSAGGILIQTMKDIGFGSNIGRDETFFQYTTTGWMMWNLMIAGLAWGTRLVLYDGSPFYPDIPNFLRMVHEQAVTVLGVSPRFLAEMHARKIEPLELASFDALKTIMSGGAVLTPPLHTWAYRAFGGKIRVFSGYGGTDICSAFLTNVPSMPVFAGELSSKVLGIKVEVYDLSGVNIENTSEAGELVVTRPHPSVPVYFWGDISGEKLRNAYYEKYPGVWNQGDFVTVNPTTKGLMILGRSDGVLNRNGIRFGSSEIYSVLETFSPTIQDTLCIGQRRLFDEDERILLFVKMQIGQKLSENLKRDIHGKIREQLTSRHIPDDILEVADIPYTRNGKKIELAVKQIVSGSKLTPSGDVANPEVLQLYYQFAELPTAKRSLSESRGVGVKSKL